MNLPAGTQNRCVDVMTSWFDATLCLCTYRDAVLEICGWVVKRAEHLPIASISELPRQIQEPKWSKCPVVHVDVTGGMLILELFKLHQLLDAIEEDTIPGWASASGATGSILEGQR